MVRLYLHQLPRGSAAKRYALSLFVSVSIESTCIECRTAAQPQSPFIITACSCFIALACSCFIALWLGAGVAATSIKDTCFNYIHGVRKFPKTPSLQTAALRVEAVALAGAPAVARAEVLAGVLAVAIGRYQTAALCAAGAGQRQLPSVRKTESCGGTCFRTNPPKSCPGTACRAQTS